VHCYESGVGDLELADDAGCLAAVREFLSFLPSNNGEMPPRHEAGDSPERRLDGMAQIVPTSPRHAYDMRRVVRAIADGGRVFEIKPGWARNIITALVRLDGHPVGVVASQPMFKAGALDNDAADKAARFIRMCDAFNIPLLFL